MKDWYLLTPFALLGFVLGMWGFLSCNNALSCHSATLGDAAFRTLLLIFHVGANFTLKGATRAPLPLLIAQTMLPLVLVLGTAAAGARLVLLNLRHDVQLALVRAMRGHVIVCGLGRTGTEAARALAGKRGRVVAVDLDPLGLGASAVGAMGVPVLIGDATTAKTLARAGLARARAVVMSTGSDARNMEICLSIQASRDATSPGLLLFPEVRSHWLQETLTAQTMPVLSSDLSLHPFRANAVLARALLRASPFRIPAACSTLLFLGFGDLAETILRTATLSVFAIPGFRIRAICNDASAQERFKRVRAAPWSKSADMTFLDQSFVSGESLHRDMMRRQLVEYVPDIVIVTLPDDDLSLQVAVDLRNELDALQRFDVAIFFRVREQVRLSGLIETVNELPFCTHRLAAFGNLGEVVSPAALFDEQLDLMARVVHETYLSRSSGEGPSRHPWSTLPEHYRRASRGAADHIPINLALAGYRAAEGAGTSDDLDEAGILTMARAEHYRWALDLKALGWTFGEQHSDTMRQHPLLVPWDDLPMTAKTENADRMRALPALLATAGMRLRRVSYLWLDPTVEVDWASAEAVAEDPDRAVLIRRAPGLRAEALADLERRYPKVARSVAGWSASRTQAISQDLPLFPTSADC